MRYFDPVDDEFNHYDYDKNVLRFAKVKDEKPSLWAPVIEKAFVKVLGNYQSAEGGIEETVFRTLTGAPSASY